MRGGDGMWCFSRVEGGMVLKDYAEGVMNGEDDWACRVGAGGGSEVDGEVNSVCELEAVQMGKNWQSSCWVYLWS